MHVLLTVSDFYTYAFFQCLVNVLMTFIMTYENSTISAFTILVLFNTHKKYVS